MIRGVPAGYESDEEFDDDYYDDYSYAPKKNVIDYALKKPEINPVVTQSICLASKEVRICFVYFK